MPQPAAHVATGPTIPLSVRLPTGVPPQGQYAQAERHIDDFNRLVSELTSPDGLLGAKVGYVPECVLH
jgi:hypothetical protein